MPSESGLSNNVYTAPQAPDLLGHAIELAKIIPNAGIEFQKAQAIASQNAKAQAEYQLMAQKAKAFMDLYPAFKEAQIAKLNAETANLPAKADLLRAQAKFQTNHANMYDPNLASKGTGLEVFDEPMANLGKGGPTTPVATPGSPFQRLDADGNVVTTPEAPVAAPVAVPNPGLSLGGDYDPSITATE